MMIQKLWIPVPCEIDDLMAMMKKKALTQGYFTEGVDEVVDVGGMHVVLGKEGPSWFTKGPCIRVLYAKENISGLSTSLEGVLSHSTIQKYYLLTEVL